MVTNEQRYAAETSAREQAGFSTAANGQTGRGTQASFAQDRDYLNMVHDMQQGQWDRVVPLLRALQARYPQAAELDALLQDATFRLHLESDWGDKVQGVQGLTPPMRTLLTIGPVVAIVLLLVFGFIYYGRIEGVNARSDQQQELLLAAQAALNAGQYREALDLFDNILASNPSHAEALKGQNETRRQLQLATDYQLALDHLQAGNYQEALALLTALQQAAPGYRDVAKRLAEVNLFIGAPQLFADAEFAFSNGLWLSAIRQYEGISQVDSAYEAATVRLHLATAYVRAGQQLLALRPSDRNLPKQASDYFQKAAQLGLDNAELAQANQWLSAYLEGERLVNQGSYEQGASQLASIHAERPDYLGGYVTELLYRAYMNMADSYAQQQDFTKALATYEQAAALGMDNNGLAATRVAEMNQRLAPTPTPLPTPAPVVYVAPAPAPVVEATPGVTWQEQYRGWILFRSTRNGGEAFYIMRSNGSEAQPAPAEVANNAAPLYQKQQWSPDGTQVVYVERAADQTGDNIAKKQANSPTGTMLTTYVGTEYDPVWSADGQSIAFVSNHTGNDEIWVMNQDGTNHRQLTLNGWEWDKHPSFSPDGSQLVFYSNRSGPRQIWVMNSNGTNPINLSNNGSDEWDPIWIR
ncbi:MAG: PD40 domain-containing protein [Caldilineaceae bacterium]|nr:PD40 domain-containing protein [Caldilineaceae bacterium]